MRLSVRRITARAMAVGVSLLIPGLLFGGVLPPVAAAAEPVSDPAALVNPFIGTQNFGNTFPGAAAPFGMVQVSPDTGGQGGYDYQQDKIHGFSQTHLSGVGCGVSGELPIMPTTGAVDSVNPDTYRSTFTHDDEEPPPATTGWVCRRTTSMPS